MLILHLFIFHIVISGVASWVVWKSPMFQCKHALSVGGDKHLTTTHNTEVKDPNNPSKQLVEQALQLFDCLTSPKDQDDPEYDIEKDARRDELLLSNDYSSLKAELRRLGLRTSGDKLEMISRILVHTIDPSIQYDEISGLGTKLKYIDEEDLASQKVQLRSTEERAQDSEYNINPDADDMRVLRRDPSIGNLNTDQRITSRPVMDGLNRKEVQYPTVHVRRTEEQARRDDYLSVQDVYNINQQENKYNNQAYIVSGKDVLRNWARTGAAIVLLPDKQASWRDKSLRILADEIAFATQAVVILPDIYRSSLEDNSESSTDVSSVSSAEHTATVIDDIIATIQFVRTEYSAGTVSFAGIGYGASIALEASCILHDIGRLAQYIDIQTQLRDAEYLQEDRRNAAIDTSVAIDSALSNPNSTEYKLLHRVFNTDRNLFPVARSIISLQDTAVATGDSSSDTHTGSSSGSGDSHSIPEEELEAFFYENFTDLLDKPNMHGSERVSGVSAEKVKRDDASSIGRQNSDESGSNSVPSEMEEERNSREQQAREQQHITKESTLRQEWRTTYTSAIRAQERAYITPYSTLSVREMKEFIPRSIFVISPTNINMTAIGDELNTPIFVTSNGVSNIVKKLYERLKERITDILDYSFREYLQASVDYLINPLNEYDQKCSQEAISMGALWLEAFSAKTIEDLPSGIGSCKHSDTAYQVIRPEEMVGPLRSSVVATYLHDIPNFFHNSNSIV